jgi:L-lactate utilization protein LutB
MSGTLTGHPVLDPRHAPPFPIAALPVLRNPQLRKNVAHATNMIQTKRARLVAEKTDWQELRTAAAISKSSRSAAQLPVARSTGLRML